MKMRKSKKLLALLLSAVMAVSAASVVGVSAAQTDEQTAAATDNADTVGAEEEGVTLADNEGEDFNGAKDEAEAIAAVDDAHSAAAEPDEEIVAATEAPTEPQIPVPGNVVNLQKTSYATNSISLTWNKVANAVGYIVYYYNADGEEGGWHKAGTTKNTAFTLNRLRNTTQYHFMVSAYLTYNGKNYEGNRTLKKTATQPGAVGMLLRVRSSQIIELRWNANTKATGYKIFRSSPESGNKEVLYKTIVGKQNHNFVDTNVKVGNIYVYNVKAYRECDNGCGYSSPSNRLKCLSGLGAPSFNISTSRSKVDLVWNYNKYATRYDIYCYDKPDSLSGTKLGSTTSNRFTSPRLQPGRKLYFRVYPLYVTKQHSITGTAINRTLTVNGNIYGKAMGDTYVEVSIDKQHMWYYKNGKLIVETDVVTGNADGWHNTPKGYFSMYQRARNTTLSGPGYSSFVEYWMAFSGGCGIHDASWRSRFGGSIYKGDGSHGCVNTPIDKVRIIYNNSDYGTPVIVY